MYLVNYNDGLSSKNIPVNLIIGLLKIPHDERSFKDHETIYKYLKDNQVLNRIEHKKSLNARLNCVAILQLAEKVDDKQFKIISKLKVVSEKQPSKEFRSNKKQIVYDEYYVGIGMDTYIDTVTKDEEWLHRKIDRINKYTLFQCMTYQQLLHLAYYAQQKFYKYRQIVYNEGDESDYLYLIQKGEFHLLKLNQKPALQKKKSKLTLIENPNRTPNTKYTLSDVGIVEGGLGQVFGEQQLLQNNKREQTVKCMSTDNCVLIIKKQCYLRVLESGKTKINWLKHRRQMIKMAKSNLVNQILETKNQHYKQKNTTESDLPSSCSLQQSLPIIPPSQSSPKINRLSNNDIAFLKKFKKKDKYLQSKMKKNQFSNEKSKYLNNQPESNKQTSFQMKGLVEQLRNWSSMQPAIGLIQKRFQFHKSNKETQIPQRKKTHQAMFPITIPKKTLKELDQINKRILRQQRRKSQPIAHSKDFMTRLLKNSMQKAGYFSYQKLQEKGIDQEVYDIKTNLMKPKYKGQQKYETISNDEKDMDTFTRFYQDRQ